MNTDSASSDARQGHFTDWPTGPLEDLVRKLVGGVPALLGSARGDMEAHFRSVLQQQLARLDLCSRQEFDAQARVLERTRQRLGQLEEKVVLLEQRLQRLG